MVTLGAGPSGCYMYREKTLYTVVIHLKIVVLCLTAVVHVGKDNLTTEVSRVEKGERWRNRVPLTGYATLYCNATCSTERWNQSGWCGHG